MWPFKKSEAKTVIEDISKPEALVCGYCKIQIQLGAGLYWFKDRTIVHSGCRGGYEDYSEGYIYRCPPCNGSGSITETILEDQRAPGWRLYDHNHWYTSNKCYLCLGRGKNKWPARQVPFGFKWEL
jgi:hypothetical protein